MEEKLHIVQEEQKEYLLLKIEGRIDGYWSRHLDEYLESRMQSGIYNLALDLSGVYYMSSLGIRILVKYVKLYKQLQGNFGILQASKSVTDLLEMVGLNTVLTWQSVAPEGVGEDTVKTTEAGGYTFQTTSVSCDNPATCTLTGNPAKLREGGYTSADCQSVTFGRNQFGIGLGAIGLNFDDCKERFGEFVALGDAVVYSPAGKSGSPDYMVRTGTLIPKMEMLYGITFEGNFEKVVHFSAKDPDHTIRFSDLIADLMDLSGYEQLVMVMLAESAGLVGISLNQSPAAFPPETAEPFAFPGIREHINFTTEPDHKKMMTITVGIASAKATEDLKLFTRPLSPNSLVQQHFHSALFTQHPLRKKEIDLDETIRTFFEQDKIRGVVHLLNDNRELTGIGESEFKGGVCWIGQFKSTTKIL